MRYAGFWVRLAAYFIDTLIKLLLAAVLFVFVLVAFSISKNLGEILFVVAAVFAIIIYLSYGAFFLAREGTTPGKKMLGLVVVDKNNKTPLSWKTTLIRELAIKILMNEIIIGAIVLVSAILIAADKEKRALWDIGSGTYVVYKNQNK